MESESEDIRSQFEAMVAGWHDSKGEEPQAPETQGGLARTADGSWIDTATGDALPPDRSAEVERLWREWAPKLPDEVRRSVEGRGDGGDEAGDREPRAPAPSPPSLAQELDL